MRPKQVSFKHENEAIFLTKNESNYGSNCQFSLKRTKFHADGKCPVYVRYTMNNQRFELSTGIFIQSDIWNANKQQISGEEIKLLNNRLVKINLVYRTFILFISTVKNCSQFIQIKR